MDCRLSIVDCRTTSSVRIEKLYYFYCHCEEQRDEAIQGADYTQPTTDIPLDRHSQLPFLRDDNGVKLIKSSKVKREEGQLIADLKDVGLRPRYNFGLSIERPRRSVALQKMLLLYAYSHYRIFAYAHFPFDFLTY